MGDDDSEEDMPLAATVPRAVQRATRLGLPGAEGSDSDEEKPLSQLLTRSKLLDIPPVDTGGPDLPLASAAIVNDVLVDDEDEDEDDKPLGLRVSRFVPSQSQLGHVDAEDDDDQPLAFHPEQQRRTQYNMLVQHQQQMMLQAQIQQSMMFSPPSLMSSGFLRRSRAPAGDAYDSPSSCQSTSWRTGYNKVRTSRSVATRNRGRRKTMNYRISRAIVILPSFLHGRLPSVSTLFHIASKDIVS
jgi:hypothetical protein